MTENLTPVIIYTDGACSGNPGPGGWAALLRSGKHQKEISGGEDQTTNNRMELTAAIEALRALNKPCRVLIYTDSEYLQRGVTEWMAGWKRRGWQRKEGPLKNADLWRSLDELLDVHTVEWQWVKGHAGHAENERVDQLARQEIDLRRRL
ncbi:MAG TPA: ribonuclease HI [Anaerolineaceae bacterium]|nr:ribonuclease HI [Anaerolineaceae bacterium]HPN51434.1 ribonuclease HI [Anaerolineaceae bacterium]